MLKQPVLICPKCGQPLFVHLDINFNLIYHFQQYFRDYKTKEGVLSLRRFTKKPDVGLKQNYIVDVSCQEDNCHFKLENLQRDGFPGQEEICNKVLDLARQEYEELCRRFKRKI